MQRPVSASRVLGIFYGWVVVHHLVTLLNYPSVWWFRYMESELTLSSSLMWKYTDKSFSVNMSLVFVDPTGNTSCEVSGKKGRQGRTRATNPPWEDRRLLCFSSSISRSTYSFQPGCETKGSLLLFPPQKHVTGRSICIRLQSNEERTQ